MPSLEARAHAYSEGLSPNLWTAMLLFALTLAVVYGLVARLGCGGDPD